MFIAHNYEVGLGAGRGDMQVWRMWLLAQALLLRWASEWRAW